MLCGLVKKTPLGYYCANLAGSDDLLACFVFRWLAERPPHAMPSSTLFMPYPYVFPLRRGMLSLTIAMFFEECGKPEDAAGEHDEGT